MRLQEHVPLAPHTTFRIGGPARFFTQVGTIQELVEACAFARERNLKICVLGGGSNVLVADEGFDGLVIKIEIKGLTLSNPLTRGLKPELGPLAEGSSEHTMFVEAGAGEFWDDLVRCAVSKKLWGVENLSGIPGTVGGAIVGNIGAYGQALSQTLHAVEVFDTTTGNTTQFSNAECLFDYRDSLLKREPRYIVLRARFAFSTAPNPELSYRDLAEIFKDESHPTLAAIRESVLDIRKGKFPDLQKEGTAGSFFKNPIVTPEIAAKLQIQFPELPLFSIPETQGVKVPLAWLLDHALNLKGYANGRARLFERQPLVIAASFGATAHDIRALASEVVEKIFSLCAIRIEPEVQIM